MVTKSPSHYTSGSTEVWDFIRDQDLNYHLGCAIKYICRAGFKDSKVEDLEKAMQNKNDPNYQKYLKIREKNLHKMNPIPVCKFNE